MDDVESDHIFQTVRKGSCSVSPYTPDIMLGPQLLNRRSISMSPSIDERRRTISVSPSSRSSIVDMEMKSDIKLNDLRQRRRGSVALLQSLSKTEHLPYSVWPKTRRESQHSLSQETLLTSRTILGDAAKYRLMSKSALLSYEEEMIESQTEPDKQEPDEMNTSCWK